MKDQVDFQQNNAKSRDLMNFDHVSSYVIFMLHKPRQKPKIRRVNMMKAEIQGFVESQIFLKLFTQKFTLLLSQDFTKVRTSFYRLFIPTTMI